MVQSAVDRLDLHGEDGVRMCEGRKRWKFEYDKRWNLKKQYITHIKDHAMIVFNGKDCPLCSVMRWASWKLKEATPK